jgi:hypothetical protein
VLGHLRIHSQILNRENSVLYPVLLIRIRDPVFFLPLDPGSHIRDGKNRSGINILDHISNSLVRGTNGTEILCCGSGSGIRCLFNLGSGIEKFGAGKNIPDPQNCPSLKLFDRCGTVRILILPV